MWSEYLSLLDPNIGGFTSVCGVQGCAEGPGRQIVIWYDVANDEGGGPNRPEIQTIYYHVAVNELPIYGQLRTLCSTSRNTTWEQVVIAQNPNYEVCAIRTASTTSGYFLGTARLLGFATAPHIHYEVYIDRGNDGQLDRPSGANLNDLEDPLMAFSTIR